MTNRVSHTPGPQSNWTPGPWTTHPNDPWNVYGVRDGHEITICDVRHAGSQRSEANARLIAAAPELLAAAKALRDCYSNPHVHEHESCWASLEAAIEKAEPSAVIRTDMEDPTAILDVHGGPLAEYEARRNLERQGDNRNNLCRCGHEKHDGECMGAGKHRNVGGPQGVNLGCYCIEYSGETVD